jgi:hypothetical protein
VLFCNDLLLAQAARIWEMPHPGYAEANRLIAECLSALTAPLRFGGHDTPPAEPAALLAALGAELSGPAPLLTAQCWPLAAFADARRRRWTLPQLQRDVLRAAGHSPFAPLERAEAAAVFVRARLRHRADEPPLVEVSGHMPPGSQESAAVFAPSPAVPRTLRRMAKQARMALRADGAARFCAAQGVSAEALEAAIAALAD